MSKKQEKTATTEKIQRKKIITLPLILALIGVVISLLLIERFYTFEPFYYLTGQYPYPFMPYGNLVVKEEWITTTVLLGQWSLGICSLLTVGTLVFRKKIQFAKILGILSILVSISFFSSFYFIHKEYNYEFNPYLFGYMTLDGKYIANVGRYFQTVEKYGFEPDAYRPFQTLDDAIQGLEFAKEKKDKTLYSYVFRDLQKFGFEKSVDYYKDKTFQLYFMTEVIGKDYDEQYIKNVSLVGKFMNSESKIIQDIAKQVSILYTQYSDGKLSKDSFLSEMKQINLGLYKRTQGIEGVEYSIF